VLKRYRGQPLRERLDRLPTYAELPIAHGYPANAAWGVFGDTDSLGTINLLTPERVRAAAQLVRRGAVFPLNWDLELPDPPVLGRGRLSHNILNVGWATDDHYDNFYPQGSSQWDALCHIGHPEFGLYNHRDIGKVSGRLGSPNGIENLARRGIAGRFVLVDVPSYRRSIGLGFDPAAGEQVTVDELDLILEAQRVELEIGDIVLIRFGWIAWYESTSQARRAELARDPGFLVSGLARAERTAEWLWDHHVAAVAADNPGLESNPIDPTTIDGFLHYRLIPLLGLLVGEMFALDALADDCAQDRVFDGLFTAAPLNKVGGSGSPANALAIK
jgi:kynurenine formamidase